MADSKISALTALGGAPATTDLVPLVDVSDTTQAASGTTKQMTVANLIAGFPNASGSTSGLLSSADWTTFNGKVGGSGTAENLPKFSGSGTLADSLLFESTNTIEQRNGTNAQTWNLYRTYSGAGANYERLFATWNVALSEWRIGTEKAGTGVARDLAFYRDGSRFIKLTSTEVLFDENLKFNSGTSTISWTTRSQISTPADGNLLFRNNGGTDFGRIQLGGTTSSFPSIKRSAATLAFRLADDSADAGISAGATSLSGLLSFTGTSHAGIQLNNLTTTQRDAISGPAAGMLIWNTTTGRANSYTGSAWTSGWVRLEGDVMTGALGITQGAITADASALSITSTYNNAGVTFGGALKLNVTNTASAAGSLLFDVQLGGSTRLNLTTSGNLNIPSGNCSVGGSFVISSDTTLARDSADTFAQRRTTNAQTFRIYNTVTGTDYTATGDFERGFLSWVSNEFRIGTEKGSGGGSARSVHIYRDGVNVATFGSGAFTAVAGYGYLAGDGGFIGINARSRIYSPTNGNLQFGNAANTGFGLLQLGGTSNLFPALKRSSATLQCRLADDSAFGVFECLYLKTNNGTFLVSGTALTNGAGANSATLTNAPAAGNPTKWIPIDDNGTTRYIPCW